MCSQPFEPYGYACVANFTTWDGQEGHEVVCDDFYAFFDDSWY